MKRETTMCVLTPAVRYLIFQLVIFPHVPYVAVKKSKCLVSQDLFWCAAKDSA
jgi:hypothetical protein